MTREEARKKAEIMLAYANGKEIEFYNAKYKKWTSIYDPEFDSYIDCYRIKRDPKYRPFKDSNECWQEMLKHKPFGWVFDGSFYNTQICRVRECGVNLFNEYISYSDAVGNKILRFADGTLFGIKEEEES